MVVEGSPQVGEGTRVPRNLLWVNSFIIFLMSVLIVENEVPTCTKGKQMEIIPTSPSTSLAFVLFFEACESHIGIRLAIL